VFLVPDVSYAHPLLLQPNSKPLITTNIEAQGHEQSFKVTPGQEVVIPAKNGYSIHFRAGFVPTNNKGTVSNHALSPKNGSIPIGDCGDAWGDVSYVNVFGFTSYYYKITDHFCNNGLAVTSQLPAVDSGRGIPGITLTSHSTSIGWISKPWSAYAQGNYNFNIGIVTQWGSIGSNCAGSIQLSLLGDGPFFVNKTNCE
jgi:hypothetical protein